MATFSDTMFLDAIASPSIYPCQSVSEIWRELLHLRAFCFIDLVYLPCVAFRVKFVDICGRNFSSIGFGVKIWQSFIMQDFKHKFFPSVRQLRKTEERHY